MIQQLDDNGDARPPLVGRPRERRTLDRTVETLRGGRSSTLVISGERGIGKTALLDYLQERAGGCRVVTASAVAPEAELAYAGLHQLCAPLLDRLERLPAPQRGALGTAFGLAEGRAPDRLFLGLAVLGLLCDAASEQPLVCLVDDAQRLDDPSSEVLAFVARRLAAQPVGLVVASRQPGPWLRALPAMPVTGLAEREARALLLSVVRGPLDDRVAQRMVAETSGNPGALLGYARSLTPAQLAGGFGRPDSAPIGRTVDKRLERAMAALSPDTRIVLLTAAAEPLGDPLLLWPALERLGIQPAVVDAAQERGLLAVGGRVRFRDPMLRSLIYRSAPPRELRRVHAALAEVTDPQRDPERRTWHRAYAASGPDEEVASELEKAAAGAAARGGAAVRSSFLVRAAALTADPRRRARRAAEAADAAWQAGDPEAAMRAVVSAESGPLDDVARARVDVVRARVALVWGAEDAPRRLLDVAARAASHDPALARDAYLDALGATLHRARTDGCEPLDVARRALATPPAPEEARAVDHLLEAVARQLVEGHLAAGDSLKAAAKAFAGDATPPVGLVGGWLAAHVAALLWRHDLQRRLAERQVRAVREAGAFSVLPQAMTQLVEIHLRSGEREEAGRLVQELDAGGGALLAEAAAVTAAYRGDEDEGRRLVAVAMTHLPPGPHGGGTLIEFADLLLSNGLGRYEDAVRRGRWILEDADPVRRGSRALPEIVEAAVRAGAQDVARTALSRLAESARISGTDWALGLVARSRALLAGGADAERLYLEALTRLAGPGSRVDLARAHLVYGEWLRREGRRVDAREQLRTAHDMLREMGVEGFAERAGRELRATGETVRKRVMETRDDLTPQEEEIARLARDGLSNPEIGARLYISPRTVEWHLRKIFVKLGINSRLALRDVLPEAEKVPA